MKAKVIAVVGVDGSGKSTFSTDLATTLCAYGKEAEVLHPDGFTTVSGWYWFIHTYSRWWRYAEEHSSKLLALLAFCSGIIFPFAKQAFRRRGVQYIVVEHHPRVEYPAFGRIYGGTLGALLGRVASWFWREPDHVVYINIPILTAQKNIEKRGKKVQPHEYSLRRVKALLEKEINCLSCKITRCRFPARVSDCLEHILSAS